MHGSDRVYSSLFPRLPSCSLSSRTHAGWHPPVPTGTAAEGLRCKQQPRDPVILLKNLINPFFLKNEAALVEGEACLAAPHSCISLST